jgi:hypothetical protein
MGGIAALKLVRDAGLTGLVRRGSEHALDAVGSERLLPVLPELRPLLPGGGLRRGATIGIATHLPARAEASAKGLAPGPAASGLRSEATREDVALRALGPARAEASAKGSEASAKGSEASAKGSGATSLLLALLAEASRAGSWCAVVGLPTLGVAAAAELGIALDRLVLVPHPGPDWPTVVAALLDGFDIVVTAASVSISPAIASRLAARARQRGAVLMAYGPWPSVDLTLQAVNPVWHGIEAGRGRLRGRQLSVVARGRGGAAAPRLTHMWLPSPSGLMVETGDDELATVHPFRKSRMAG